MKTIKQLMEEVVAGDASGNAENISAGTNTGAVVNKGPEVIGKKKKELDETKSEESNK